MNKKIKYVSIFIILFLILVSLISIDTNKKIIPKKTIYKEEKQKELFENYYNRAKKLVNEMTLEDKINQLLLIRYKENEINNVAGYIFYEKDFKNKNKEEIQNMINQLQKNTNIPFLIAVDEEGGKVVRVSSNTNIVPEKFKSSKELYDIGGFQLIKEDVITKNNILSDLGINLNLAPVVDICENELDYMYERSIGYGVDVTSEYAKTVIDASKNTKVSYVLKHFPGYGNNIDTHTNESIDNRSLDEILKKDIIPFKKGIESNAEAVLISHNIVTSIDENNPASLSKEVINLLKNNLNFTGIIMTDDLDMGATKNIDLKYIKALNAGNNILIVTNYDDAYNEIKNNINKLITEEQINEKVIKIIAWKYYKKIIN